MTIATGGQTEQARASPAGPLRLLGIGEHTDILKDLQRYAATENVEFDCVRDPAAALRALSHGSWSAIIVALDDDPEEHLTWWAEVLRRTPKRPRLVTVVPAPSIGFALRASQLGVFEVLPREVGRDRFVQLLGRIRAAVDEKPLPLPRVKPIAVGASRMVSESPSMIPVFRAIAQVAPSDTTVLIQGESGTGKELVARAVHMFGPRAHAPFVPVNCAAIPENLLESELFGHEKGSFTGAIAKKIGRFERANEGTLFLDEIGDMSLALQSKILRAIQEREIERVGGTESRPVNVRLIAATNRDLRAMIEGGQFREDLFFRLAVVTIKLPRLADRGDDLLALTATFLEEFGGHYSKAFTSISDQATALLQRHEWVGNVRELRNVIERAVLIAEGPTLLAEHLPEEWRTTGTPVGTVEDGPLTLREMEARHIAHVLDRTRGQISEAARLLGVHRNTLSRKIREYGL